MGQGGSIVIEEGNAGRESIASDNEDRKAGGDFLNNGHLPVPQDGVGWAIPTGAEVFALAEGQVVNDTGDEVVVKILPGENPIQLIKPREGIIGGAVVRT